MKIIPIAKNRCFIQLDNGEILDFNDGSSVPKGTVTIQLMSPTVARMVTIIPTQYDGSVQLLVEDIE